MAKSPMIGVFDSGVGGLSVLREIRAQLPQADLVYFADQAHVPYGSRSIEEIRAFAEAITRLLLERGAAAIVVACNTASAAALKHLRATFPPVPFVGLEPAVKPAAELSQARVIGVLATPATFQGELFASVVERFARDVKVLTQVCPGLVEQIEAGQLDAPKTKTILNDALAPLTAQGMDTLALACTHYPFVIPAIAEIVGATVRIVDPAPAVARQTGRVAGDRAARGERRLTLISSGDVEELRTFAEKVAGVNGEIEPAEWRGEKVLSRSVERWRSSR